MYAPARHDESTTHAEYVRQQAEALRASAYGLTDEQARSTPCRSNLSIAGVLKHVTHVYAKTLEIETPWMPEATGPEAAKAAYFDSFTPTDDETLDVLLERFDLVMDVLAQQIAGADPDAESVVPPQPWFGIAEVADVHARFHHAHAIEELARHAGHADIIREQIDGATSPELLLAVWGQPGNEFVQPWQGSGPSA
ncbi:mycothiol transferase [Kytococcus sp. Marseille-QA3725]